MEPPNQAPLPRVGLGSCDGPKPRPDRLRIASSEPTVATVGALSVTWLCTQSRPGRRVSTTVADGLAHQRSKKASAAGLSTSAPTPDGSRYVTESSMAWHAATDPAWNQGCMMPRRKSLGDVELTEGP